MDTVAIETVTYFGIGSNPQPHTMSIVAPLNLPLQGFLNLYSLFEDTLACSFPITIPDTISSVETLEESDYEIIVLPLDNGFTLVDVIEFDPGPAVLNCFDITGREFVRKQLEIDAAGNGNCTIMLPSQGFYFISVQQKSKSAAKKFIH